MYCDLVYANYYIHGCLVISSINSPFDFHKPSGKILKNPVFKSTYIFPMSHCTVCYLYSLLPDFSISENIINIET